MKVRATKDYFDRALNKLVEVGEKFDVADERAKVLISAGVAERVTETTTPTTEKVAKPKPRKKND